MTTEDEVKPFEENFEWTAENELHLFEAMDGPKPVGINKHFIMACICEKFETLVGRPVSPEIIWKQLNSMYDMAALDKKESIPFPTNEEDFILPDDEFKELMNEKIEKAKTEPVNEPPPPPPAKDGRSTPKVTKDNKQTKETANKKEKEKEKEKEEEKEKIVESDEKESESDKKETEETETEVEKKKGKGKKEEKPTPGKRGKRAKKTEEETTAGNTNNKKSEEEAPRTKKGKHPIGKRTLRSRGDDSASNKSSTPPPSKRARRI